MLTERIGEIAALGTALLWSLTYLQFTLAVRAIGPARLNRLRLLAALGFLLLVHTVVYHVPIPLNAEWSRWGWLIVSGVIGFTVSDALLFSALLRLGAHRTSLVMALIPVVSALLAWGVFGERLTWMQILAALVTLSGIAIVISARKHGEERATSGVWIGVLFALGAVTTQSIRYILSKQGMAGDFPVLSANAMQILAATVAAWIPAFLRRDVRGSFRSLIRRRALPTTTGGAMTGPFLGVTLSMVALTRAPVGIASTLMALVPVFLLPFSHFVLKERIGPRAVLGTVLAVGGVAFLFLS